MSLTDEYTFAHAGVLQSVVVLKPSGGGDWQVAGFHIQVATDQQLAANRFTLAGKGPGQLLFLALAIASPLAMVAALIKVIRTPGLSRKWLWGLLAFVGLVSLQMNWATGGFSWQPIYLGFINAGVMRGPSDFDPWILTAMLPVGALLILAGVWGNPRRAKQKPAPRDLSQTF